MAKKGKKGTKFCPKCGAELKEDDTFCTSCGYNFEQRKKKKFNIKMIIAVIILFIIAFLAIRYFQGKPIIPNIGFFKNMTG